MGMPMPGGSPFAPPMRPPQQAQPKLKFHCTCGEQTEEEGETEEMKKRQAPEQPSFFDRLNEALSAQGLSCSCENVEIEGEMPVFMPPPMPDMPPMPPMSPDMPGGMPPQMPAGMPPMPPMSPDMPPPMPDMPELPEMPNL